MTELHGGRTDHLEVSPNLWAGIGLVRGGAGTALVGSHDEVADRIAEYHDLGIDEFILSGYPHLEEAYRVGEGLVPVLRTRGLINSPEPPSSSDTTVDGPKTPDIDRFSARQQRDVTEPSHRLRRPRRSRDRLGDEPGGFVTSARERARLHELRVSRDEESWNVTVRPVFSRRRNLAFVACSRIGGTSGERTLSTLREGCRDPSRTCDFLGTHLGRPPSVPQLRFKTG